MLVEHLRLPRQMNRTPLVNILFVLQNTPRTSKALPGIEIEALPARSTTAKFDLALFLTETPAGLQGNVVFSTDLFKESSIALLMRRFAILLRELAAHPTAPLDTLEFLSEDEKAQREQREKSAREKARKSLLSNKSEEVDLSAYNGNFGQKSSTQD